MDWSERRVGTAHRETVLADRAYCAVCGLVGPNADPYYHGDSFTLYTYEATLFCEDEVGARFVVWRGQVSAPNEETASQVVINDHWDDRLGRASCVPVTRIEEV